MTEREEQLAKQLRQSRADYDALSQQRDKQARAIRFSVSRQHKAVINMDTRTYPITLTKADCELLLDNMERFKRWYSAIKNKLV